MANGTPPFRVGPLLAGLWFFTLVVGCQGQDRPALDARAIDAVNDGAIPLDTTAGDGGCDPEDLDCGNGTCVAASLLCDGKDDCGNNRDEGPDAGCPPTCPCASCCAPGGGCGDGYKDTSCGGAGEWCVDCTALGLQCRWGIQTGPRCATPQPNGSPCIDGADCASGYCSADGVCYTPCVPDMGPCFSTDVCCESGQICDMSSPGAPPGICCVPAGGTANTCLQCCFNTGCRAQAPPKTGVLCTAAFP